MTKRLQQALGIMGCLVLSFCLLSACEYNYIDTAGVMPDEVNYDEDIQPIFKTNCISCHVNVATPPVLRQGESYESLINGNYINTEEPEQSKLMTKINSGHPFVDVPSDFEKELILQWIKEGALDN